MDREPIDPNINTESKSDTPTPRTNFETEVRTNHESEQDLAQQQAVQSQMLISHKITMKKCQN